MGQTLGELALPLVCHEVVWVCGLGDDALPLPTMATCSSQENWPKVTRDGELTLPHSLSVALRRAAPPPPLGNTLAMALMAKAMGE